MKDKKHILDNDLEDVNIPDSFASISKKENPYKVPEGYFNSMEHAVHDKINARKINVFDRVIQVLKKPVVAVPVGLAAAAIALLLIINKPGNEKILEPVNFSQEELVESGIFMDMDEDLLFESLINSNSTQASNMNSNEFNTEAEQFLLDHRIDINLIMNEL